MTRSHRQTRVGRLVVVAVVGVAVVAGLVAGTAAGGPVAVAAEDRVDVVVLFEDDDARSEAAVRAVDGRVTGGHEVDVAPVLFATVPESAVETLRSRPGVVSVVRDRSTVQTVGSVDAASTATLQEAGWGNERIRAGEAAAEVGSSAQSDVDVAVVDTGVDTDHPQLTDALAWGVNTTGETTTDGLSTAEDGDGHGTFVAGVVAAAADGTTPVGVSPDVDVYAVKVLEGREGSLSDLVEGIDAATKGPDGELGTADDADVLSISLGSAEGTAALQRAVDDASDRAVVVAAAGNFGDGDPDTDEVTYPARYDGAIAVAATDRNDETPTFSSEGPAVELSAPGVDVTSTVRGGGAGTGTGTSFAAPFVSGTAALVAAEDGSLTPAEVRDRLRAATVDVETDGRDRFSGYGLVRADAAVAGESLDDGDGGEDGELGVTLETPADGAAVSGTVEIAAVVDDPGAGRPTVEVSIDGGPWRSMSDDDDRYVYAWDTTTVESGEYALTVRAREDGTTATDTATVTVDNDGPPAVSIDEPAVDTAIEGSTEVVVGASDEETPAAELRVEVSFAGRPWQTATYEPDRGFVAEVDADRQAGNYTLRARATDGSGRQTTVERTVTVDADDPPTVTIVEPTNDSVAGRLAVAAAVSDDRTSTAELTVEYRLGDDRWRSLEYDPARGLFVAERGLYTVADGNRTLAVRADDGSLNATATRTVTVDNAGLASEEIGLTANRTTVRDGTVTVDVEAVSERDVEWMQLYVTGVPETWTVTDVNEDGAYYASRLRSWFWSGGLTGGSSRSAGLSLHVPENASTEATLTAIVVTDTGERQGQRIVVGSDQRDPAIRAIVGDELEFQDILLALDYVNSGEPVPGTDGRTVSLGQVLRLLDEFNGRN